MNQPPTPMPIQHPFNPKSGLTLASQLRLVTLSILLKKTPLSQHSIRNLDVIHVKWLV